jgi:hypothetical protein
MYVTVVQMVVFYCNISKYSSAVYYTLYNSFNISDLHFDLHMWFLRVNRVRGQPWPSPAQPLDSVGTLAASKIEIRLS